MKSLKVELHIQHLEKSFQIIKKYGMKLKLAQYVFKVSARKFLRFIINRRRIEVNPKKVKAVINLKSSTNIKEVQCLIGG